MERSNKVALFMHGHYRFGKNPPILLKQVKQAHFAENKDRKAKVKTFQIGVFNILKIVTF
jgi:hypothetical protein